MTKTVRYGEPLTHQRSGNDQLYGNGSDGNVVVSTNTTITSDMYYNTLTVNSGVILNTNGYRIFVKDTLTLNGFIGIGAMSGFLVTEPSSNTSTGTVAGHTTSAITYRLGGQGGGGTNPGVTTLPSYLTKDINAMSGGVFTDSAGNISVIRGGSAGTTGTIGTTTPALTNSDSWPNKAGIAGLNGTGPGVTTTVGVPGGKGATGTDGTATGATPGPGGAGGAGGAGGGVVCVVARTILGSGSIVSLGRSGLAGSAGTAGSPGTAGTAGSPAPTLAVHNPPTSVPNPPSFTPSHHHHYTKHSDFHGHAVRAHPHVQQHVCCAQEHLHACCDKYGNHHSHATPHHHHHGTPHHHNHTSPHHHHNGHYHHPHNDGPHGGAHHYDGHWWHAYFQLSHHYPFPHYHQKPNGHGHHTHGNGDGHHHSGVYHGYFGGHDGHQHGHSYHTHSNGHTPHHGGHAHHPTTNAQYHHNHVAPHTHPNPPSYYPGGAGGAGGAAAPAVTGGTGKRGGAGGGGAILVIADSVAGTITYDARAGLTADVDSYAASAGTAYVLINA